MCGIVGAIAERDVVPVLLEGLRRLEYRGYDSSGIAIINSEKCIDRERMLGKVEMLAGALKQRPVNGPWVLPIPVGQRMVSQASKMPIHISVVKGWPLSTTALLKIINN